MVGRIEPKVSSVHHQFRITDFRANRGSQVLYPRLQPLHHSKKIKKCQRSHATPTNRYDNATIHYHQSIYIIT